MIDKLPSRPEHEIQGFRFVYSNCDHDLEGDVVAVLESDPGVWAGHAAWSFHGSIWKHTDGKWYEEIRCYTVRVETISADTIEDLIEEANDKYGSA